MSQIAIQYTPQTNSDSQSPAMCHRICYRVQGDITAYCCHIDNTPSIAGVPKTYTIDVGDESPACIPAIIPIDPETCLTSSYEGYVQACCEDISDLQGRVTWNAVFQPTPSCVNKLVCCQSQRSLKTSFFTITNAGSGYDDSLDPITITLIRDISDPVPSGGANEAIVTAGISGGVVVAILVDPGNRGLYGKIPTIIIPSPTLGGPVQATAVLAVPCVSLGAASLGPYIGDCMSSPMGFSAFHLQLGECADVCLPDSFPFVYTNNGLSGLPDTANFNYLQTGCCDCTTCSNIDVVTTSSRGQITLIYTRCSITGAEAHPVSIFTSGSGTISLNCVVPNSVYCSDDPNAIVSVTQTTPCAGCP